MKRYLLILLLMASPIQAEEAIPDIVDLSQPSIYQRVDILEQKQRADSIYIGTLSIAMWVTSYYAGCYLEANETELEPHDKVVMGFCNVMTIGIPVVYGLKVLIGLGIGK